MPNGSKARLKMLINWGVKDEARSKSDTYADKKFENDVSIICK